MDIDLLRTVVSDSNLAQYTIAALSGLLASGGIHELTQSSNPTVRNGLRYVLPMLAVAVACVTQDPTLAAGAFAAGTASSYLGSMPPETQTQSEST